MLLEASCGEECYDEIERGLDPSVAMRGEDPSGAFLLDGGYSRIDCKAPPGRKKHGRALKSFDGLVVGLMLHSAIFAHERTGVRTIALTGGCFMNRILERNLVHVLKEFKKFRILL